jgi:hypothetical protein
MSRNGGSPAEHELTELAKRFHHWRHTRATARERIPQALWEQAVAVSRVLPISQVARTLRLSPGELKKRRTASRNPRPTTSTPAALGCVEVTEPPPWLRLSSGPEVEITRPDGSRMQIHYREPHAPLAALVRVFLGAA